MGKGGGGKHLRCLNQNALQVLRERQHDGVHEPCGGR